MLKITNLNKSFGGIKALQDLNCTIEEKKVTAFIGPNGAGKTTLFNIITDLIKPDSGKITCYGKSLIGLEPFEIANLGINRTFQQVRLFKNLTILDHLLMVENNDDTKYFKNIFKNKKTAIKKYQKILDELGIALKPETLASDMSYGQRKLLQLAMAFLRPHILLLLDEPVAGVNAVIQDKIEKLLFEKKEKEETMIIIDHDMKFVRLLADHVIVLDAGQLLTQGPPDEVLKKPEVLEAYLGQ